MRATRRSGSAAAALAPASDLQAPLARVLERRVRALDDDLLDARRGEVDAVHKARVATRRLREAVPLTLARGRGKRLLRRLRKLTRALGPLRELDVALAGVDRSHRTAAHARPRRAAARISRPNARRHWRASARRCDRRRAPSAWSRVSRSRSQWVETAEGAARLARSCAAAAGRAHHRSGSPAARGGGDRGRDLHRRARPCRAHRGQAAALRAGARRRAARRADRSLVASLEGDAGRPGRAARSGRAACPCCRASTPRCGGAPAHDLDALSASLEEEAVTCTRATCDGRARSSCSRIAFAIGWPHAWTLPPLPRPTRHRRGPRRRLARRRASARSPRTASRSGGARRRASSRSTPGRTSILTSPFVRARQTADYLAAAWPKPPKVVELAALRAGRTAEGCAEGAAAGQARERGSRRPRARPRRAGRARSSASRRRSRFKKGGVARIDVAILPPPAGSGILQWWLTPRVLRTLAKASDAPGRLDSRLPPDVYDLGAWRDHAALRAPR